ncbi:MAG: hypothetical protein ABI758_01195 [Candidatus Woesebacteria bacterium]
MEEKPKPSELLHAREILEKYRRLDITTIQTLSDTLLYVPSVGRQLVTILREYGEPSNITLPFNAPSKPTRFGPLFSLIKDIGEGTVSLSGRYEGVHMKKWDKKKTREPKRLESFSLGDLVPNIDIDIPTLAPFVLNAIVNRGSFEPVYPVNFPDVPSVQQHYAFLLQEIISDLVESLPGDLK